MPWPDCSKKEKNPPTPSREEKNSASPWQGPSPWIPRASSSTNPRPCSTPRAGELLRVLRNLHASGKTIVSITHRLEEILSCDRAIILHRGEIAWEGTVSALFLSDLPFKEWGLDIPPLVSFWRDLRAEGRSVPPVPTVAAMADALCQ